MVEDRTRLDEPRPIGPIVARVVDGLLDRDRARLSADHAGREQNACDQSCYLDDFHDPSSQL